MRFTHNPLFQAQELVEPFMLNSCVASSRAGSPPTGTTRPFALVDVLIRASMYAFDDHIERQRCCCWAVTGANAAGANTRLGKMIRTVARGGRLDVQ